MCFFTQYVAIFLHTMLKKIGFLQMRNAFDSHNHKINITSNMKTRTIARQEANAAAEAKTEIYTEFIFHQICGVSQGCSQLDINDEDLHHFALKMRNGNRLPFTHLRP